MFDLFKIVSDDLLPDAKIKTPLQRKGDVTFEISYLIEKLRQLKNEVILTELTKYGETIIIYRQLVSEDELNLALRSRIFLRKDKAHLLLQCIFPIKRNSKY